MTKFIGVTTAERRIILRALELVSRERFERLESCKPRADMPPVKPGVVAGYEADIELIDRLYDAARHGDATCAHPGCGGKIVQIVCERCRD